jgi:hypothetical protein
VEGDVSFGCFGGNAAKTTEKDGYFLPQGLFSPAAARKVTFLSCVFGRLRPKTQERDVLFRPAGGEKALMRLAPTPTAEVVSL